MIVVMKLKAIKDKNNLILEGAECFDVALCLDCGQAFRWERAEDGTWQGIAMGKFLRLSQNGDKITLFDTTEEDFNNIWHSYFDLDRDYNAIISTYDDKSLLVACNAYPGIRILKQDEWEALCSFIISANNNIPRIKGIIGRLCEQFGNKIEGGYTFPTAQALAGLTVEDLAPIRSGFRAKYIIDAAQKVASGEVDIEQVKALPFDEAKAQLLKIKGVGEKVAQCTLLYGFGRVEAFPRDVWVNRIVAELYPDGLPECIRDTEGIAQQYLFHWRRNA